MSGNNHEAVVRVESALGRPDGGEEYAQHLRDIAERGECPFCLGRLLKEHKNPILGETDSWLITDNMYPAKGAEHHLLAIHKTHIEHWADLSDQAWIEVRRIMLGEVALRGMLGGTFYMRWGDPKFSSASVVHLHAQLAAGPGTPGSDPVLTRVG